MRKDWELFFLLLTALGLNETTHAHTMTSDFFLAPKLAIDQS